MVRSETADGGGAGPPTKRARSIPAEPPPVRPDCNPSEKGGRSVVVGGSVDPAQALQGWQEALHLLNHGPVTPRPPQLQHTTGLARQIFLERPVQKRAKGHDKWVGSGGRKGSTEYWLADDIGVRKRYGKVTCVAAGSPSLKYAHYSRLRRIPASAGATGTADVPGQVVEDKSTALFVTTSQPAPTTTASALFNECPPASWVTSRADLSVGHVCSMDVTAVEIPVDDGTLSAMFRKGQVLDFAAMQRLVVMLGPAGDSLPERPLVIEDEGVEGGIGMMFREACLQSLRRYKSRKSGASQIDVWKPYGGTSTTRLLLPPSLQLPGVKGPQEIIRRSGKIIRTNGKTSLRYRQYELSIVGDKISPNTGHALFHVLQSTLGARRKACAAGPEVPTRKPTQAKELRRTGGPNIQAETLKEHSRTHQLERLLPSLADAGLDMLTSSSDWERDVSCSSVFTEEMDADTSWDDVLAVESHPNIQDWHSEITSSPECGVDEWELDESCSNPEPFNVGEDWGSDEIWSGETNAEAVSKPQECGSQWGSDHSEWVVSGHGEWGTFNDGAEATAPATLPSAHLLPTPNYSTYLRASAAAMCAVLCMNATTQQLYAESGTDSVFLHRTLQDTGGAEFSLLMFDSENVSLDARVSSGLSFPCWLHPFSAALEALGAWTDYGVSSACLVHFEIFTVFMLMVGVAVDAVLDLGLCNPDRPEKIFRAVQVLSRQTPIRCVLYIRILRLLARAFRPLSECTVLVLLPIVVGVVAYKFYSRPRSSGAAGPIQRRPLDLLGMARGLLFCWVTEQAITLVAIDPSRLSYDFYDDAIAGFVRVCAILAVRFLWGLLSLYRSLEGELEGKTHNWGHWCKVNPERKIAMAMVPMLAARIGKIEACTS